MDNNDGILQSIRESCALHGIPVIRPETERLLSVMCRLVNPQKILEIGTGIGYSAIMMAHLLRNGGRIDTIEVDPANAEEARNNIKKAGLNYKIHLVEGNALEVIECLSGKYDLIFLDAAKGQYPALLKGCEKLLRINGLLISDNVLYKGMVDGRTPLVKRKRTIVKRLGMFLDEICGSDKFDTVIVPIGDGIAISCLMEQE
jgi:predicted O-methyltransferase YrrM